MTVKVRPKTKSLSLLDQFGAWLRGNDRADHTIRVYLQTLHQFAAWFEHTNGYTLTTENLTPADIKQYRESLIKQGKKPASTNSALVALKAFGKWIAETQGLTDPTARVKLVAINRFKSGNGQAPKSLDKQELFKLHQALDQRLAYAERKDHELAWLYRDQAIVMTLLHTGLRVGELCALTTSDLTLKPRSGQLVIRRGKGMKYREVPLNAPAREALATWLKHRAGLVSDDVTALFVTKYRAGIQPGAVQYLLREIAEDAGIEITPHTLRHSFAKSLIDAGVNIEQVATLLGHTSLETTRIYTTPTEQDLVKAVEKLES
jgi:site-specific recombinase XerD